jgi:hypothetical protein
LQCGDIVDIRVGRFGHRLVQVSGAFDDGVWPLKGFDGTQVHRTDSQIYIPWSLSFGRIDNDRVLNRPHSLPVFSNISDEVTTPSVAPPNPHAVSSSPDLFGQVQRDSAVGDGQTQ